MKTTQEKKINEAYQEVVSEKSRKKTGIKDNKGNMIYDGDELYIKYFGYASISWDKKESTWVFNNGEFIVPYDTVKGDIENIVK